MKRKISKLGILSKTSTVRMILGCLLMLSSIMGRGQSDSSVALAGIAHVAVRVSNLENSRAFYHKLGYEEAFAMEKSGVPTEAFFKVNDRQFIELYPQHRPDEAIGFLHVCFEGKNLTQLHEAYVERGLAPTAVRKAGAGNLLFTMQGPEKQNIEYTQYMPGSRHTLDVGKHLGPHRVADRMVGVGIEMENIPAAEAYYQDKLSFSQAQQAEEPGSPSYDLPGDSGEQIAFLSRSSTSHYHLVLSVRNLREAEKQLRLLKISVRKSKGVLAVQDPDGNVMVFVQKQ